jgi:hypothetical protein
MDNGGVHITMLGEKRAEYPSGMVKLRRLTGGRDSLGAGLRRGMGLRSRLETGGGGGWGLGCAVSCACVALILDGGRGGGMGGSTLRR